MSVDYKNLAGELKEVVGTKNVLNDPVDLSVYDCDAETLDLATPDLVVLPGSKAELKKVVEIAVKYGAPFTPRGAGTGLSGGATTVNGGLSIALTRMNRVLEVDPLEMTARVEVGATNLSVSEAALKYGLFFAPDPSSQIASTIGGNIAENAGGPHTLKYGMTTDHVLGLTVVMPDGEIASFGGKTTARLGLDWVGLFIGSEGTLGIACEATLKLTRLPQMVDTVLVYFDSLEDGGKAVSAVVAAGIIPAAMEMIDQLALTAVENAHKLGLDITSGALLIIELDGPELAIAYQRKVVEKVLAEHTARKMTWAANPEERKRLWKARKSAFGALGRIAPHAYLLDGVIPRSKLAEAITQIKAIADKYQLIAANLYHAGDGNLHPTLLYHRDNLDEVKRVLLAGNEILSMCVQLGGTLSGEHGIGIEKLHAMQNFLSPPELGLMDAIRLAFNADGLCNPGKIIPTTKICGESGKRPLLRHQLSSLC